MKGANIIQSIDNLQNYQLHQKKLNRIKKEIEVKKKSGGIIDKQREELQRRVNNNKMKNHEFNDQQKIIEIERQNKNLIDKLFDISQGRRAGVDSGLMDPSQMQSTIYNSKIGIAQPSIMMQTSSVMSIGPTGQKKSLHYYQKMKEAAKIDEENSKMMDRIIDTKSVISKSKQDRDWEKHQQLLKQLHSASSQDQIQKLMKRKQEMQQQAQPKTSLPPLGFDYPKSPERSVFTNQKASQLSLAQRSTSQDTNSRKLKTPKPIVSIHADEERGGTVDAKQSAEIMSKMPKSFQQNYSSAPNTKQLKSTKSQQVFQQKEEKKNIPKPTLHTTSNSKSLNQIQVQKQGTYGQKKLEQPVITQKQVVKEEDYEDDDDYEDDFGEAEQAKQANTSAQGGGAFQTKQTKPVVEAKKIASEKDSEYNDESYIEEEPVEQAQTKMSGFNFKDFKKASDFKEEEVDENMDESIVEERGQMMENGGIKNLRHQEERVEVEEEVEEDYEEDFD